jgi:hypothetical protein
VRTLYVCWLVVVRDDDERGEGYIKSYPTYTLKRVHPVCCRVCYVYCFSALLAARAAPLVCRQSLVVVLLLVSPGAPLNDLCTLVGAAFERGRSPAPAGVFQGTYAERDSLFPSPRCHSPPLSLLPRCLQPGRSLCVAVRQRHTEAPAPCLDMATLSTHAHIHSLPPLTRSAFLARSRAAVVLRARPPRPVKPAPGSRKCRFTPCLGRAR